MMDTEPRTVEIRFHRADETLVSNGIFDMRPRSGWPHTLILPVGPTRVEIRVGGHRWQSYVSIDNWIAWDFTWMESTAWTVERFLYNGIVWQLEYRTRHPAFEPDTP